MSTAVNMKGSGRFFVTFARQIVILEDSDTFHNVPHCWLEKSRETVLEKLPVTIQ
jgi:hypothetical protein